MMNQHSFSIDSFPSTEDGVACCRVCHCPMFYLESINIGSRGEVFSGGRICRNQRDCQWLCNDKTDNTILTVEYCSRECAKKKGLEDDYDYYQKIQDPLVPDIDGCGGGMPFKNTLSIFCGPFCKGDCVQKEYDFRNRYDFDDY